jgi:membrane-associated phospholipid phosphatase
MHPFSTTQPPYKPNFWLDIRSTTQPPSSTQSMLVSMTSGHGLVGLMKRGLKAMRAGGLPHLPSTPPAHGPAQPPSWVHSADVVGVLAADELLEKFKIVASPWTATGGVPQASVLFEFTAASGSNANWAPHVLRAHSAAVYAASLARVKTTMAGAAPHVDDISFQAPVPSIVMALALGMDADAGTASYRYAYTALLIDVIVDVVTAPVHRLKKLIRVPRPSDGVWSLNPPIAPQPLTVPGYTAYPSGHAAVSAALATVLAALGKNTSKANDLKKLALSVATNRERAGLHTDIDSTEGLALGEAMGKWMVDAATNHAAVFPTWADVYNAAAAEW